MVMSPEPVKRVAGGTQSRTQFSVCCLNTGSRHSGQAVQKLFLVLVRLDVRFAESARQFGPHQLVASRLAKLRQIVLQSRTSDGDICGFSGHANGDK